MKKIVCLLGLCSLTAWGETNRAKFGFNVEPIIGYERVQKLVPTAHTTDRLVYGARITAGLPLISAEAEYLRATDTETFPSIDTSITDTADKAKVGARSQITLSKLLSVTARAGVQAKQNKHSQTVSGVTSESTDPIVYNPYAGAGLRVGMGKRFSLNGDLVVIFGDFPDMTKNEYQATLGFSVKLP